MPCAVKAPLTDDALSKHMIETEARILVHLHRAKEIPSPGSTTLDWWQTAPTCGRDRIVKYIGIKELGGLSRRDLKTPVVSRQGSVRRAPRADSRGHARSVSDSTALRALAEKQADREREHDRSE